MQSGRTMQRRSPAAEPGPPPNVPVRSISPGVGLQPRSSITAPRPALVQVQSGSSGSTKRSNTSSSSNMPLSQIEKSVTHLLVATKQLLETLTQWSRGQASDGQVSDVYVRLGYEFNMACRAFTAINVDTSDLGNVPELLRHILEATLSQEASVESLEKYLPRIRDIIINLLHGLKRKQQKLRQKQPRDKSSEPPERTTSSSSIGSGNTGLTGLLDESIENGYRGEPLQGGLNSSPNRRFQPQRDQTRTSATSEQSSISSTTMQNIPIIAPPYPGDESSIPGGPNPANDFSIDSFPPPPPPPKGPSSALAALQKGGDLERRASRRYSQYQINKHLGGLGNGVPILPPQNTPLPNRGRGEVRESMRAVQVRETLRQHNRNPSSTSRGGFDSSPVRVPSRVSEEGSSPAPAELPADVKERDGSPVARTPDDKYPQASATLKGPLQDALPIMGVPELMGRSRSRSDSQSRKTPEPKVPSVQSTPEQRAQQRRDQSFFDQTPPPSAKELTLFLQYKSKVKKFVLPEGYSELSIGRLQLAFIEKFSWNTHSNGADLPDIYIQDPVSGVRHELEDLSDIKDRTVLVLNVEQLDEVKRHIDDGIGQLKKMVEVVRQNVDDQGAALARVSDQQQETAKEMARMAAAPPTIIAQSMGSPKSGGGAVSPGRRLDAGQLGEVQSLRRDLAVLRQTYSSFQAEVQGSMSALRNKANNVKMVAVKASVPDIDGDGGYAYVAKGRKLLNVDSDRLVTKVDDLQDLVEDLRKDVVHRGVRPLPRQLETVSRDITVLTKELTRMADYMKREKPIWTKIWEKELEDVCQGRDELRLMEDLMVDLQDDLEKAHETFALVEQATKEQAKDQGTGASASTARTFSQGLNRLGNSLDQNRAKEGVLGEVRALQPNHENRLEAIERAEKLRQKELESRQGNPLTKELTDFVGEGKLKKSGGVEEVERARKAKEDRIRREVWERQNGMVPVDPIGEEPIPVDAAAG